MLDSHGAAAHAEGEERRREKEMKKEKKKKSKKSAPGTLAEFREGSDALTLDLSNGGAVAPKGTGRGALLRSIAIFLESSGFSKTLATFKSEAKLEVLFNARILSCFSIRIIGSSLLMSNSIWIYTEIAVHTVCLAVQKWRIQRSVG